MVLIIDTHLFRILKVPNYDVVVLLLDGGVACVKKSNNKKKNYVKKRKFTGIVNCETNYNKTIQDKNDIDNNNSNKIQ